MAKICPILKAGTMQTRSLPMDNRSFDDNGVKLQRPFTIRYNPECLGEDCEWHGHGCPAHPAG